MGDERPGPGPAPGRRREPCGRAFHLPHQPVTLPAYTTFDAALQVALGEWDLDVNVKNLTNRKHYVSAHGSNDNLIPPGSPRAVQVTLRTHF